MIKLFRLSNNDHAHTCLQSTSPKIYKKSTTNKNEVLHGMAHVCHRVNFGMKVLISIFGNYLHNLCARKQYISRQ